MAGATAIPRPFHGHPTTISRHKTYKSRKSHLPGGASENLALAPVLATSKLLGMVENNEETEAPCPPEAPYQSNPGFKTTTATTSTWAWLPRADSQIENGAR
jgi:hypothetical protein